MASTKEDINHYVASTSRDNAFGQCRCCLKEGYHRDIEEPYYRNGTSEVYRDIFLHCFNLFLSTNTKLTNLICTSCIHQLNDSMEFRAMVAQSEQQLLIMSHSNKTIFSNDQKLVTHSEMDIKIELEEVKEEPQHCSVDYDDADNDHDTQSTKELDLKKNETPEHEKAEYITVEVPCTSNDLNNYIPRKSEKSNIICQINESKNSNTNFSTMKCNIVDKVINSEVSDERQANIAQDKNTESFSHSSKEYSNSCKEIYSCDTCSHISRQKIGLIRHLRIHTGEKPYSCKICDKKFIQKCNLKKHVVKHTGEKAFACTICDKKFVQNYDLNKHFRIHTGEKPYACKICDEKFIQKCHLNRHIVTKHTGDRPYSCTLCNKKFLQNCDLNKHSRIHTGERPFACKICDKKFVQKGGLNRHVRIHTGEKPYACKICNKKYTQKGKLNDHIKIHTGGKP